jgi:hypothetical protein
MNGPGPSELRLDMRLRENHYRKGLPLFKSVCTFQLTRLGRELDLISQKLFAT